MNHDHAPKSGERSLLVAAVTLLCLCFITGGDSAHTNAGMMASQLLALPIFLVALIQCVDRGTLKPNRLAIFAVLLIVSLPLLQLLPLPMGLWSVSAERVGLLKDLNAVGVATVDHRWSLSPIATERNLYFLLPGMALFFCMCALGRSSWKTMLFVVIGLCVSNLVLAFAQVIAGQQSVLNPYPDFAPALAGIFANRNHQSDMLAIGLMLVCVLLLDTWKRRHESTRSGARISLLTLIALIIVFALPLVGSRAGVLVAMIMLMGVLLSAGLPTLRTFRKNRLLQIGSVTTLLVFVVGLYSALAWMQSDVSESALAGSRSGILTETLQIGREHAPLGAGIGTFVPAFQLGAGDDFLIGGYINNAHNDYAQWWLEGGVLGLLVVLLALAVLIKTLVSLLRLRQGSSARVYGMAAMMGIGVIVLHSTVDYPLRTQALMAVFSVLSGIAIAAANAGSAMKSLAGRHKESVAPARLT